MYLCVKNSQVYHVPIQIEIYWLEANTSQVRDHTHGNRHCRTVVMKWLDEDRNFGWHQHRNNCYEYFLGKREPRV